MLVNLEHQSNIEYWYIRNLRGHKVIHWKPIYMGFGLKDLEPQLLTQEYMFEKYWWNDPLRWVCE